MGSESAGFEQTPRDIVREVPEAQGGAAEVLETSVDRLGRPVAGTWPVEEREDVGGALLMVRPSLRISTSAAGTPVVIVAITACMACLAFFLSGSR